MRSFLKAECEQWIVKFDFTTFDLRRSTMTGRSGSIRIVAYVPKDEIDMVEVKQLCVNEMLRLKPKWNILGLDIKSVTKSSKKLKNPSNHDRINR
jgi:hypothetical protein